MVFQKVIFHALALLILSGLAGAQAGTIQEKIPDQYLIKFSSPISILTQRQLNKDLGLNIEKANQLSGSLYTKGKLNESLAKALLSKGLLEYIEPNYKLERMNTPNDPQAVSQWPNQEQSTDIDLDLFDAWQVSTGSDEIVVGIIDSGLNYNHPDLAGNIWQNTAEIPFNGIDDDGNGVVDDFYGYNSVSNSGDPLDNNGHGSHIAGIIGAQGNNSLGISGVNWNVKLLGMKFLDGAGNGSTQNAIEAIEYAIALKRRGVNIRVLNNSWGGNFFSRALEDAVRATNSEGILFVAASGNSGSDNDFRPIYPASLDLENVVSVAAMGPGGNLASFSNYGQDSVDLAAPGVDIFSTWLGSEYRDLSGTSMAAPYVSGVAALLLSSEPGLSAAQLKARLTSTVRPLPGLAGLVRSGGMVNAGFALSNTLAPPEDIIEQVEYVQTRFPAREDNRLGERILTSDDGYQVVELPFEFDFFDERFGRIAISSNGRIIPLGVGEALPRQPDFANNLRPGILPWHDDLFPAPGADGGVWARTSSTSVTITWISRLYGHRNSPDPVTNMKFQTVINTNGGIEFNYIDVTSGDQLFEHGNSASVGLIPFISAGNKRVAITHNRPNPDVLSSGNGVGFKLEEGSRVKNDFDADGKSDLVVWRPSSGHWFVALSGSGYRAENHLIHQLGLPGDIPITGDFDGDGRTDMTVWRPTDGNWFFRLSSQNFANISVTQWGLPGDQPLADDFDGDQQTDLAVYRPSTGTFFSLLSGNGYNPALGSVVQLGNSEHQPLAGDYNGDGQADLFAVWTPARLWSIKDRQNNILEQQLPWGLPGDGIDSCDWDGDGRSDRLVTRINPTTSLLEWFVAGSNGVVYTKSFGIFGDIPGCNGDYDGDGVSDSRVWRPQDGNWFVDGSSGEQLMIQFGLPGDIPL